MRAHEGGQGDFVVVLSLRQFESALTIFPMRRRCPFVHIMIYYAVESNDNGPT